MRFFLPTLISCSTALVVVSNAHAADLPARTSAPAPQIYAAPAFTWTGFYAGVNAGYGWGSGDNTITYNAASGLATGSDDSSGFIGGAQVGYNYQLTPGYGVVVGVEADLQYASLDSTSPYYESATGNYTFSGTPSLDYFGTVRGRVGYAFDRALVYGTAGLAYGGGDAGDSSSSSVSVSGFDETGFGYTLGAGLEYAFTPNITAKIEGLYVNIDRGTGTVYEAGAAVGETSGRNEFGLVRAGLNYKF